MKAPFSTKLLLPSEPLFGRDNMIRRFYAYAKGGDNIAFIGMRRVGKTSVIKRVVEMLSNIDDSNVCPIYVDVKNINEKGTVNFYCRLSAIVLSSLYDSGVLQEKLIYKTFEIPFFTEEIDIYDFLVNQKLNSPRIKEVFSFIVTNAFYKTHKTILLILDEYESVFKSIDSGEDINHLRNMSQNPVDSKTGLSVFSMWVVGAREWSYFISKYGSGEFNTCAPRKILPIDLQEFMEMWEYECAKIENEIDRERVAQYAEAAYQYSGGVPFFGKLIGSHILIEETYPSYDIFRSNFKEILGSLEIEEVEILKTLSRKPQFIEGSNFLTFLNSVGLVRSNEQGEYYIPIKFLEEYLLNDNFVSNEERNILEEYVNEIIRKVQKINNNRFIKGKGYIFDADADTTSQFNSLKTLTDTEDKYKIFSSTLYLILYESTKRNGNPRSTLFDLDLHFGNHEFLAYVATNRHIYGSHQLSKFETLKGHKTIGELCKEFLGVERLPQFETDFSKMQIGFLKRFNLYLDEIIEFISPDIKETCQPIPISEKNKSEVKTKMEDIKDEKGKEENVYRLRNPTRQSLKILGKIDPKNLSSNLNRGNQINLHGKIDIEGNYVTVDCQSKRYKIDVYNGFQEGFEKDKFDYKLNTKVIFDLKTKKGLNGKEFTYVINIRPNK